MRIPATALLRPPQGETEWERYYDLRWRVLREPWGQPRGSERDELEPEAFHLAVWDVAGEPIAVGRLHTNSPLEAQVRFMAVDPRFKGCGLGTRVLAGLEKRARDLGVERLVLNAREEARGFYRRHGYEEIGAAPTLFGALLHFRMKKSIALAP